MPAPLNPCIAPPSLSKRPRAGAPLPPFRVSAVRPMGQLFRTNFASAAAVQEATLAALGPEMERAAAVMIACYRGGGKAMFCGNGGSAADAQHLAAEFVGRYLAERRPLPALALHANTSSLTAIGNDYGYELSFARQVEAF